MRPLSPKTLRAVACSLLLAAATPAAATEEGKKLLDLEVLYSPDSDKRINFTGTPPTRFAWIDGTTYLQARPTKDGGGALRVDARSGRSAPLYDAAKMAAAFAKLPGFSAEDGEEIASGCPNVGDSERPMFGCASTFELSPDRSTALVSFADDLFVYRFGSDAAVRLTAGPEAEEEAGFSPDGRLVGFVRGNDLHVVEVATGRERRLTTDGGRKVLNGRLDWLYQEEVYGRGDYRAHWWSPDSRRIAFLRLDESPVPEYTLVDDISVRPEVEVMFYPKAGDPNPVVALGVVAVLGGEPVWADLGRYRASDPLIVGVAWTPDAAKVVAQVQDREQTWLDLALVDPASGAVQVLFRDSSGAFIEAGEEAVFLRDGSFVWPTMRSGWTQLYHYSAAGELQAEVTPGEWDVDEVYGVDEERRLVLFSANRDDPAGRQIYRAALDGSGLTRLSQRPGTHRATFSPDFRYYIDLWSDVATPPQVRLHDGVGANGAELRVIDENRVAALDEYQLQPVERLQVPARDGYAMEAMVIKPPDFDPKQRYPVLIYHYGGPHAPVVEDEWAPSRPLWHQMLAQRGYVIWMCDNRSASGKGWKGTFEAHRQMGVLELRDTEDGVTWLKAQSWVDPERIGIWGWSYGGFMTAYALTHSASFKLGIAGAPVTDWRLYDTIYTERHMGTPQNNPEGYEKTSAVAAAANLHGELLLIHGAADDNVHPQNTAKLAYELQKAGKRFELMLYPRSRHGVVDRAQTYHLMTMMTEFIVDNL